MSAQAPFGSPQAPKEGNRRAAASVKPSPRKQKVQATAKRAASSSAPESTRSPQKERAEVRKPEDSAHSFDKYAFDVDNLLEDIEQKEVGDPLALLFVHFPPYHIPQPPPTRLSHR